MTCGSVHWQDDCRFFGDLSIDHELTLAFDGSSDPSFCGGFAPSVATRSLTLRAPAFQRRTRGFLLAHIERGITSRECIHRTHWISERFIGQDMWGQVM